ncbi:MAG: O-antigen ligase family protein [Synechococcales cyanobacterium CRU_2_2]|nr:O-antigen ligase family protein [Synechococcales cyanobacterium CRU_2_2]
MSIWRYSVWGLAILLLLPRHKHALYTATRDPWLWALVMLEALSFLWSSSPEVSKEGTREVLQMTTFGLYLATRFTPRQQVKLVAITFGISGLLSLAAGVVMPAVAIHSTDHPGAWRGLFDYKNTLGSYMVVSVVSCFLLATDRVGKSRWAWSGVGLGVLLILLSTSKTSLVVSILVMSLIYFCQNFKLRGKVAVIALDLTFLLVSGLLVFAVSQWVPLLTSLGKDPTMTGRTPMWAVMIARIWDSPLLGYGRAAFWAEGSPYALEAGSAVSMNFIPPHAHNGFIEVALDVGLLGLVLFLISFFRALFQAIARASMSRNSGDLWPLGILTFLALNNVTESYLLRLSNAYWILYVVVALSLPKLSHQSSQINRFLDLRIRLAIAHQQDKTGQNKTR